MKKFKKITKEDLQYIVDNAAEKDREELAEHIGVSKATLAAHMSNLRKLGVDVPKANFTGNRKVLMDFAEEWKKTHKIKKNG